MFDKKKYHKEYTFFGNLRRGFQNPVRQLKDTDVYYEALSEKKKTSKASYDHDYYMRVAKPNRTKSARNSGVHLLT
jgi:hypothetical protein